MIIRTNAAAGGVSATNAPQITYDGNWSHWYVSPFGDKAYWEAVFYSSGTLTVANSYTADLWGIGGGSFLFSGTLGAGSSTTVLGAILTGEIAITVGTGASRTNRGSGNATSIGDLLTAAGGASDIRASGERYPFGDTSRSFEAGTDGTDNGTAYGQAGWGFWRCGTDNGDGTGYGAGGDYGGQYGACVNGHDGAAVIRIAM